MREKGKETREMEKVICPRGTKDREETDTAH